MPTKRFDIGEYCTGGSIRVSVSKKDVTVQICKYKTDTPIPDGKKVISLTDSSSNIRNNVEQFCWQFTTPFYTEKVTNWLKDLQKKKTASY